MRHLNIRMAVNALCIVPLIGTASVLAWPLNFGLSILALAGAGFVGSMLAQLVLRFLDQRGSTKGIVSDEAKVKHAMQQGAQ